MRPISASSGNSRTGVEIKHDEKFSKTRNLLSINRVGFFNGLISSVKMALRRFHFRCTNMREI